MKRLVKSEKQPETIATAIQKKMIILLGFTIVCLFVVQFAILGNVGTVGPEITRVRREREEMQLNNEIMTALIREYQTNRGVVETVSIDLQMQSTDLNYLELADDELNIAQD